MFAEVRISLRGSQLAFFPQSSKAWQPVSGEIPLDDLAEVCFELFLGGFDGVLSAGSFVMFWIDLNATYFLGGYLTGCG